MTHKTIWNSHRECYCRSPDIATGIFECDICKEEKRTLVFDTAEMEYADISLCKECIDKLWEESMEEQPNYGYIETETEESLTPHVHAKVIKAWADGAKIQAYCINRWYDNEYPTWSEHIMYRVKPTYGDIQSLYVIGQPVEFFDKINGVWTEVDENHRWSEFLEYRIPVFESSNIALEQNTKNLNEQEKNLMSDVQQAKIKIRRDIQKSVRSNAEQVDGKTFFFRFGWDMTEDDPYPGEQAWIPIDASYPNSAPVWIASGDLNFITQSVVSDSEQIKPVGEIVQAFGDLTAVSIPEMPPVGTKLYTKPLKSEWLELTDDEIAETVGSPLDEVYLADFRKVLAKQKEKIMDKQKII